MGTVNLVHILELADTSGVASNWSKAKPMCDHSSNPLCTVSTCVSCVRQFDTINALSPVFTQENEG